MFKKIIKRVRRLFKRKGKMNIAVQTTPDQAQQIIFNQAVSLGMPVALSKLIVAQSGHETNGWTSHVWLTDNNGFGYGYDGAGSYKFYNSIEESVKEIVDYINRRVNDGSFTDLNQINTPDQYATLLKNAAPGAYFGDSVSNYAGGIARWFNNNLALGAGISVAGIVGVCLLIFLIIRKK